jgi:purine-binding chemotaxis protein CheW
MAELARSPALPAALAGFLNLGGTAVAVLRLDRLFGLPDSAPGLYTPLILLRDADPPVALAVERVNRIARLGPGAVRPVRPDDSFNGAVVGTATLDDQLLLVLSAERLLLDKEQQILAEYQDREQQRVAALEERP